MNGDDGDNELEARNESDDGLPAQPADLSQLNVADRVPSAGASDVGGRTPDDAAAG
ncbi:MAG: hypothetical protein ABR591_15075 [Candidatus Velthaea sp.]